MNSLRLRLVVLFLLVEAAVILSIGALALHRSRRALLESLDAQIHARLETLAAAIEERGPGEPIESELSRDWLEDFQGDDRFFEIAQPAGPVVLASDSLDGRTYGVSRGWLDGAEIGDETYHFDSWDGEEIRLARTLVSPTLPMGTDLTEENRDQAYFVQVGERTEELRDKQGDLIEYIAFVSAGILALSALLVLTAVTLGLRPVRQLAVAARGITADRLDVRLPESTLPTELRPLSRGFNQTLARVEAAFQREKQFLADASHELRTPVSVILSAAEVALRRERSVAEYIEALETSRAAAQRMQSMVHALLDLAETEHAASQAPRQAVDLAALAAEVTEFLQPLAQTHGVTVTHRASPQSVIVRGDPQRLRELVSNLTSNAILHNRPGGRATISAEAAGTEALLRVEDDGPGIAPEHLPHVFERFYRVDRARARTRGGSGLGLAIARWIVQVHGGRIDVTSRIGQGTVFTATLPRV